MNNKIYKCIHCGRNLGDKVPHRCKGTFRKRKLQFRNRLSGQLKPLVIPKTAEVAFSEELNKIIEAGNKLAEAAHKVQSDYDGIHRLRLALSEWYKVRANEFDRDSRFSV